MYYICYINASNDIMLKGDKQRTVPTHWKLLISTFYQIVNMLPFKLT